MPGWGSGGEVRATAAAARACSVLLGDISWEVAGFRLEFDLGFTSGTDGFCKSLNEGERLTNGDC